MCEMLNTPSCKKTSLGLGRSHLPYFPSARLTHRTQFNWDNVVVDLSTHQLSSAEIEVLSLGLGYCPDTNYNTFDTIKDHDHRTARWRFLEPADSGWRHCTRGVYLLGQPFLTAPGLELPSCLSGNVGTFDLCLLLFYAFVVWPIYFWNIFIFLFFCIYLFLNSVIY